MSFQIDEQNIEIIKTARKGSIGLKVEPNRIALMVPKHLSDETILLFLNSEKDWLRSQILEQKENMPKHLSLRSGSELLLFGEKILYKEDHHTDIPKMYSELSGTTLTIFCKQKRKLKHEQAAIRKQVVHFFSEQLQSVLDKYMIDFSAQVGVSVMDVSIKNYKSRWGSCYPDGRIQFNWRLAMAPISVIQYVMMHELCHLIHPNHSKAYWAEVLKYCPNYQTEKQWLSDNGASLMSL